NGGHCTDPAQCESGFCPHGICCNEPCTAPNQFCNRPDAPGICITVEPAPAPSVSGFGWLLTFASLATVAFTGIWRLRTSMRPRPELRRRTAGYAPLTAAARAAASAVPARGPACYRWQTVGGLMTNPAANGERVHYHACPLCEATCGLEIRTRGREVVAIRGDADDVFSQG